MKNKRLLFSVSTSFINKHHHEGSVSAFNKGFEPFYLTIAELAETVSFGFAFSYQYAGGVRKAENFLASDILAVDMDGNRTIEESLSDPVVKTYGSLLYTTPSHSPDRHRFRLVFALPRTITDANEIRAATRALAQRLGGDMAATDAGRMFFGSHGCLPVELNKSISDEFLNGLIEDGKVIPASDSVANKGKFVPSRSTYMLERDQLFKTSKNELVRLEEVKKTTSVYCPFHKDENPSGFISIKPNGSTYFHCSTCCMTRWMKGIEPPKYDFNSFEKFIREIKDNPPRRQEQNATPMAQAIDPVLDSHNIHFIEEKYFSLDKIQDGLTFIKSPKGTGKTTYLSDVLKKVIYASGNATLEAYEDHCDFEDKEQPIYTNKRVLLIGHRQALIGDLCKRLDLNCYLDDPADNKSDTQYRKTRYGVCLDSLWKVQGSKYDIVIIDEVEQVLSHFLSETIGQERLVIFEHFKDIIRQAKSVVSLDADLGWISFNTLTKLCELDGAARPVQVYINSFKSAEKSIQMYSLKNQLIEHIKRSVLEGKRIFVTSNSKTKIKALEKSIEDLAAQINEPIPLITITSENSKEKTTQHFIKNVKKEILKYQVVLSSPSLGTGIDITFENGASKIDCVYGLFENRINSHTEIDQQLARVRHPKEVHIWVSAVRYNFETDFGVVKGDYLASNSLVNILDGYKTEVATEAHQFDDFITMAALITAYQRASKNDLRQNFIDYKREHNWRVDDVAVDVLLVKHGKEFYETGVLINTAEEIDAVVKAKPLRKTMYMEVLERCDSNDGEVTREERQSLYRTSLELFYREQISKTLIEQDDKGTYRRKVRAFEAVLDERRIKNMIKEKKNAASVDRKSLKARESILYDNDSKYILLHEILATTPIFSNGVFDSTKCFSSDDLNKFSEHASTVKPFVETHLGVATALNVKKMPVKHLGKILKEVGLKLKNEKPKQSQGKKTRFYSLSDGDLKNMLETASKRCVSSESEWQFLNKLHKFDEVEGLEA